MGTAETGMTGDGGVQLVTAGTAGDGGGQQGQQGRQAERGMGGGALRTCTGPPTSSPGAQDPGPARASGQAAPPSPDDPKRPFHL